MPLFRFIYILAKKTLDKLLPSLVSAPTQFQLGWVGLTSSHPPTWPSCISNFLKTPFKMGRIWRCKTRFWFNLIFNKIRQGNKRERCQIGSPSVTSLVKHNLCINIQITSRVEQGHIRSSLLFQWNHIHISKLS